MNRAERLDTLDYHTAGEPLRILRSGMPPIPGDSMLARRRYMQAHHDDVRKLLMLEPRGHADMYGAVITEPVSDGADCGVLFLHNEGYSTMCGHGIIALATAASEHDLFRVNDPDRIRIDTPAGLVEARVNRNRYDHAERVVSITFLNVPAFVQEEISFGFDGRSIKATIAFGGAWYAYLDVSQTGLNIEPRNASRLIAAGREIRKVLSGTIRPEHPCGNADLNFLYGVIFVQAGTEPGCSRNACVFADGELDRSPTGTGVSGRAAIHYFRGDIGLGDSLLIESIIGTSFKVKCVRETTVGQVPAVITEVTGSAYMTGEHRFVVSEHDPLPQGLFIR